MDGQPTPEKVNLREKVALFTERADGRRPGEAVMRPPLGDVHTSRE
jgi:hypothetical protein